MGLTKTEKQGYERYFVHGDFSDVMEEGELISTNEITALDKEGEDATADIIESGTELAEGFNMYVRLKDGVQTDSPYKVTIRVETSLGNRWEVDGQMVVKEK